MVPVVNLIIKVNATINETNFEKYGAVTGTKAGNIWTVRIPRNNLKPFTELTGIEYMEIAQPVSLQMDSHVTMPM